MDENVCDYGNERSLCFRKKDWFDKSINWMIYGGCHDIVKTAKHFLFRK